MALVEGTNSYIGVAYATTYATDRNVTDFLDLFDEDKEALLISATDFLDTLIWIGLATTTTQALAWPRDAIYYDPKYGVAVELINETPVEIGEAEVELAMYFATNGSFTGKISSNSSNSGPDKIKVGSIELDGLRNDSTGTTLGGVTMPTMVANLVGHLLVSSVGASGLYRPTFRAW